MPLIVLNLMICHGNTALVIKQHRFVIEAKYNYFIAFVSNNSTGNFHNSRIALILNLLTKLDSSGEARLSNSTLMLTVSVPG